VLVLAVLAYQERNTVIARFRPRAYLTVMLFIIAALPALGTGRLVLHCALSRRDGLSYAEARQLVDELRRTNGRLGLSTGLFVLVEDQDNIEYFEPNDLRSRRAVLPLPNILIVGQSKLGVSEPPAVDGYILKREYFAHRMYTWLGIRVGRTPEAYNLAVYRKVPQDGTQ